MFIARKSMFFARGYKGHRAQIRARLQRMNLSLDETSDIQRDFRAMTIWRRYILYIFAFYTSKLIIRRCAMRS